MSASFSMVALAAISTLALFLAILNYSFWRIHPEDRTPLWLIAWLLGSIAFTVGRFLQYLPLTDHGYDTAVRMVLAASLLTAWAGYELATALVTARPAPLERILVLSIAIVCSGLIAFTSLMMTHQVVHRTFGQGGDYYGLVPGPLYGLLGAVVLALGLIAPARLLLVKAPDRTGNRLLAAGYLLFLLSATVDMVTVRNNLALPRFLDFAYLPMAMFFTYVQVNNLGRIYRHMDSEVHRRTAELEEANEVLRTEISEHTQAEQALQVSEELYRMLFDANPHPSWVYDVETLQFVVVNDAAIARYGYSRESFFEMTIEQIRPPEDLPALRQNLVSQHDDLQWSGPWRHRKADGSIILVEVLSHSLLFNGRHARLVMANDITERLHAEAALQESEQKYRALVENARDGVAIIQDGKVRYVNSRLAEMRGESVEAILGQPFGKYVHPDERQAVLDRYVRRQTGENQPLTYQTELVRADGSHAQAEITIGSISYESQRAEIVIVRDVTEQKQSEQALQRQLREMTVLNTVATVGSQATYVDELIARVTEAVGSMLYPDNFGVLLLDEHTQRWQPHASYHGTSPELLPVSHPLAEGISGKAIADGRTIRVNDVSLEPAYQEATPGIRSEMAVPIVVNGRVFGCINAESKSLDAFTEHDERVMSTIAENMATAIEKIRLLQVEKRRRQEAEILYNTTRDLVVERDLSKLLRIIVERAAGMLGAPSGAIDLCEPEKRLVRCAVSYNMEPDYTGTAISYGEGAGGIVAETGQPLIIEDYRTWPGRAALYEADQPFISMISLPLRWQGHIIGVIHVLDNTKARTFTDEDVRILDLFANQAALAVENARLFKETSQRAQEAAVLADVGRDISESLELDVTLGRIALYAKDLLRARTCAVYMPEPGTDTLRAIAALGPFAEEIKNAPIALGTGILGSIAQHRTAEMANDVGNDPRSIQVPGTEDLPVEHLMGVSVLTKDQLTGLIATWRIGVGQEFNAAELDFLTRLAGQVGVAIENARLFDSTRRHLVEIEGLHLVSTALRAAHTLEQALPILLDQLMSLLNAGGASLEMVDPESGDLVTRLATGAWTQTTGLHTPAGSGVSGPVIATMQPYVSADAFRDGKLLRAELFGGLNAIACVPVIAEHQPIGTLWIGRHKPILQEELNLLSAVGEMVGSAIHRMMLHEETGQRATEFEALYRSATSLSSQWDLPQLLEAIAAQTMELLHSTGSDVYLHERDRNELVPVVEKGGTYFLGTRIRADEGMAGRVFREQRALIVADYQRWEGRSQKFEGLPLVAVLEAPITFAGERIGVLSAYEMGDSKRKYTEADARLLSLFATQAGGAIRTARLLADLRNATGDLSMAYDTTLEGWARALELRDAETLGHSRRVTELTLRLARRLGLPESELTHIRRGVLIHDIGKMGIPDTMLKKTGPLSDDEWLEMRMHPKYAYDLLSPIAYLRPALDIPYCHHEHWDGSGYPRGLKGKQIPLPARIFTVVDVFDALSYDRAYRAAWPRRQVLDYIREQSGRLFDPEIAEAFLEMIQNKSLAPHAQGSPT